MLRPALALAGCLLLTTALLADGSVPANPPGNPPDNPPPNLIKSCYTEWYPYTFISDGQATGLSIEIYRTAIKRAGLEISFQKLPWKRCKVEFAKGMYHAVVDGGTKLQNSLYAQQRPIAWVLVFWVAMNSPKQNFSGYSQFNNATVGYVRGYGYPDDFLAHKGFRKAHAVLNDLQGLKMLNLHRLDAYFGDVINNTLLVKQNDLKVKPLPPAIQLEFLTLNFSKSLEEKHKRFEAALHNMFADGDIDSLYKKYLGITYRTLVEKYTVK